MNQLQQINLKGKQDYTLDLQGWTDKDHPQGHDYLGFYQQIFDQFVTERPVKLMEIGVANGASMWIFREYFKDYKFTGIDIEPTFHQQMEYQQELIKDSDIEFRWQSNSENPQTYQNLDNDYDIIIDDGCHNPWTQLKTFELAYPHLKIGGVYIIEDLHNANRAKEVADKIHQQYNQKPQIFFGKNYPQREDDIIVWIQKC